MPFTLPEIPAYGFEGSSLIIPVRMEIQRLDRAASHAAGPPSGWDDITSEPIRNPDGSNNLVYLSPHIRVLAQFLPLSATDHGNREEPGISGSDVSFKVKWILSKVNLTSLGLIDGPTGRPLISTGDRVLALYHAETAVLLESFSHLILRVKEIHARHPTHSAFYVMALEDLSQTSQILA